MMYKATWELLEKIAYTFNYEVINWLNGYCLIINKFTTPHFNYIDIYEYENDCYLIFLFNKQEVGRIELENNYQIKIVKSLFDGAEKA